MGICITMVEHAGLVEDYPPLVYASGSKKDVFNRVYLFGVLGRLLSKG